MKPGNWLWFLLWLVTICMVGVAKQIGRDVLQGSSPEVITRSAEALGLRGMSVNGTVHPRGSYTTYHFEYGETPAYGLKTEALPLPPRLAAFYRESWEDGLGGWDSWLTAEHRRDGGESSGYVRYSEPSQDDRNHDDGIGTLHLTHYLNSGPLGEPTARLGGNGPDLRDARISLRIRGYDWQANGSELLWWTQSQSNIELLKNPGWRRANWAYTAFTLTDLLLDGRWQRAEYRLLNDSTFWTYGGNNPTLQGESAQRYEYWPIDASQSQVNADFFHLEAYVDPERPPRGAIDFDEFEIQYRNHSLLIPSNGGKLVSWPADSQQDPAALTDGWRFGPGRIWHSVENPSSPQEFVYAFQRPITIEALQIHQNPEWPGKDVEIWTSAEGRDYQLLRRGVLPEEGRPNWNFAYWFESGLSGPASFLKVRLLSGYSRARWGLGEIEVFGRGARKLPEEEITHVTQDIGGLRPGATYHYRLIAENQLGITRGQDRVLQLPADSRPLVQTGRADQVTTGQARLQCRINPLGAGTRFYFEYGPDRRYGQRSPARYAGLQSTPGTFFERLQGLLPGRRYDYRVVAENAHGTSYGENAHFSTSTN